MVSVAMASVSPRVLAHCSNLIVTGVRCNTPEPNMHYLTSVCCSLTFLAVRLGTQFSRQSRRRLQSEGRADDHF